MQYIDTLLANFPQKPLTVVTGCRKVPFFQGLFLDVYIQSVNPKKNPRLPHTTGPKPYQLKTPTQKTQFQTKNLNPQTTIKAKMRKKCKE